MKTAPELDHILLTPADCFMLALEKQHIRRMEASNNTCRYLLELEGRLDADQFKLNIKSHHNLLRLAHLTAEKKYPLSIPSWRENEPSNEIPITVFQTDVLIPEEIVNRKISGNQPPLLSFDILFRSNGDTSLILSWHHLLMDGYGAILLMKQLANGISGKELQLHDNSSHEKLKWRELINATRAKFFIDRISRKPLSGIFTSTKKNTNTKQKVRIIRFTEEETNRLDKVGPTLGAQFGRSALYLACAARSVRTLLAEKNIPVHDFWIPVPRDQRKKGALGPLIGNHLSFIFYRLKAASLNSLKQTVSSINLQMVDQLKTNMSRDYDILMRFLRRTPSPLYYFWIKGPKGGSLASFLFTVAADHPTDFLEFNNHKIKDAWNFPSNIYPPGLTFAFMKFQNRLHLMVMYFEEVISEVDMDTIEKQIRYELVVGKELDS
jgi:hypothetical protein